MGISPANKSRFLKYVFLGLVLLTCLKQFYFIVKNSTPEIKNFLAERGNYETIRNSLSTFAAINEAKSIIPPGYPIGIPASTSGIERIAAEYALYPRDLSSHWAYLIALPGSNIAPHTYPEKKLLPNGIYIFTQKDLPYTSVQETLHPSLWKRLSVFLASIAVQTMIGMLILCLLGFPLNRTNRVWMASTSYMIGFCLVTSSLWLYLLCGFHLQINNLLILVISMLSFLLLLSFAKKTSMDRSAVFKTEKPPLEKTLFIVAALLIALIILWIISNPVKNWDAMANWMLKSKVIYHEKTLNLHSTFGHHNGYPILWPLHIAANFTLINGNYDEVALWYSALFFLIFLSQLLKGLSLMGIKPVFTTISLLVFIAYFIRKNPTISALPENTFLAFLTGLIVTLCCWLRSPKENRYLWLAVIMAVGLNLIKLEGGIATIILLFSLFIVRKPETFSKTNRWPIIIIFLTIPLCVLWYYWVVSHGFASGFTHMQDRFSLEKMLLLFRLDIKHFVLDGEILIFFFAFAYFIFFPNHRKWNTDEKFLLGVTILLMLFKWMAPIGWTKELMMQSGIFPETSWRLFLHASPSLMMLFCSRAFHQVQS